MSSPGRDSGAAERLAGIAEALPVAVVVLRARDGTVLYANEQASAMFGPTALGRAIDDVLSAPGALAVLTAGSGGEVEIDCKRGDGTPISLTAVCRRVGFEHEERESEAVLAVLRDDTERRRAEQSHAEQAAALALLAELPEKNPGPVCRLAADGTILMANAAARRFLGDGSDLRGRNWLDVVPGMTDEIWRRVLDSDSRTPHEAERNGTSIMFTHVRSASGELVFAYGADITARKAQERLAAQKAAEVAEIARFPEMNPGPVLRMDRQATVLMANQAARGVFGAELLGRCWLDLCPGMDDAAWAGILDSSGIVRREASIGERVYTFAHRWDARSQLVFVYGTDITALKQAERALRQSERMATLGTLAAGVAHELNNPAAATARAAGQLRDALVRLDEAHLRLEAAELTRDGVELLRRLEHQSREWAGRPSELGPLERSDREAEIEDWLDEHGVEDAWDLAPQLVAFGVDTTLLERLAVTLEGEALAAALSWAASSFRAASLSHEIRQGSARISEIVGALKSYSYLGQAPVQAVDVHEALDNTLVILRNKLKHGIEVIRDYSADLPPVHAWGSELNQVWTNLLDNAADAMGGQGEIIIRTRREGDKAVVEISDNGPGIPEPIQPRIFDPFFTTKEPGKGTGLGLATTWSIITERHHGTITVQSRPGRTCFTVRLPIAGPPPEPEGSGEETVP